MRSAYKLLIISILAMGIIFSMKRVLSEAPTEKAIQMRFSNSDCLESLKDLELALVSIRGTVEYSHKFYLETYIEYGINEKGDLDQEGKIVFKRVTGRFDWSFSGFEEAVKDASKKCRKYFNDFKNKKPRLTIPVDLMP
jgi:hypothetical protein